MGFRQRTFRLKKFESKNKSHVENVIMILVDGFDAVVGEKHIN
jgi:hypothetical protein